MRKYLSYVIFLWRFLATSWCMPHKQQRSVQQKFQNLYNMRSLVIITIRKNNVTWPHKEPLCARHCHARLQTSCPHDCHLDLHRGDAETSTTLIATQRNYTLRRVAYHSKRIHDFDLARCE